MTSVPDEVAAAWGWRADHIKPFGGGLINSTFAVLPHHPLDEIAILQRLHPIFGAEVNLDLEAVTAHVAARGMITPRLIRTLDGRAWHEHDGRVWRALTRVVGHTVHTVPGPNLAEAAGELVGRFHRAVADLTYHYRFARAGVHDTAAHLAKLAAHVGTGGDREATDLGREILDAAAALPAMPEAPQRHVHGDLKISNLLFTSASPATSMSVVDLTSPGVTGVALVDLDTLGMGTMAFELGDALRSWCNPNGEDAGGVTFDLPIFAAAIRGFRAVADPLITAAERRSIVVGLETVCLELASRFAVDVFRDDYFGWDPARFPSRRAHNLVRARGQLALGLAVRAARNDALDLVMT